MQLDNRVARFLAGGNLVIGVGCGEGLPLDDVGHLFGPAVGFDISAERFARRQTALRGWTFVLADLNRGIPVRSACADAVHANQVIEHVANPLYFVNEVQRVLRPGGVFVATTPNVRYLAHIWRLVVRGQGPVTSADRCRTPSDWDSGHIHFFTPSDLLWIGRSSGFSEVRSSALVADSGRLAILRRAFDRHSDNTVVKNFLSGNTLLVAVK